MKRIIIVSVVLASLVMSCGNDGQTSSQAEKIDEKNGNSDAISSSPVYKKGVELVGQYQCISCHKIDEKLTGPAYRDVANKYAGADNATITRLAQKVIDGGSGVWGEIPMTPHQNVSLDDAKTMVKYILLLKK